MNAPVPPPSDRYSKAFDWIMSDESPEVTDATVHEVMPQIAAELRDRFNLPLSETVELLCLVAVDCETPPTSAKIEQIAKRIYSADREANAARPGKRCKNKLEAALDHARRGFRVFPLHPNSKQPVYLGWQFHATSDEKRIRGWWERNPDFNIGIVMGNEFAALDVDVRKGGLETFQALAKAERLSEHETLTARTASGGLHLIYRLPEGVTLKKGTDRLGQGVDLVTGNAYLVAPGSTINGNEYRWENDGPIATMPEGLIEIARKAGSSKPKSSAAGKRLADEDEWARERRSGT